MSDSNYTGIQISLMENNGRIFILYLPLVPNGRFSFPDSSSLNSSRLIIEARGGHYFACVKPPLGFLIRPEMQNTTGIGAVNSGTGAGGMDFARVQNVQLENRFLYTIDGNGGRAALYVQWENNKDKLRHNFSLDIPRITIGRKDDNTIVYRNPYVSRCHAVVYKTGGVWKLEDNHSTNHVYVNGRMVQSCTLQAGDTINIIGMQMIFGVGFLSVNDGDEQITVNPSGLTPIRYKQSAEPAEASRIDGGEPFSPRPRRRLPMKTENIEVEGPPPALIDNQIPLMLRMGGSMAMSGAMALMGHFTSLITSVLFPLMSNRYTDNQKKEYEKKRVSVYTAYLRGKQQAIADEKENEERVLRENYPPLRDVFSYPQERRKLWERRRGDDDFLTMRVGMGSIPMFAKVDYPQKDYTMDEDVLEKQMYQLVRRQVMLSNVPVMDSFTENFVVGVTGDVTVRREFVKNLMMQMMILHSCEDLKIVLLLSPSDIPRLDYMEYVPHTWDDEKTIRFIAANESDAYHISEYLQNQLEEDLNKPRALKEILKSRPYYVVFAYDQKLLEDMEVMKRAMRSDSSCGLSVITVFPEPPKECMQVIEMSSDGHGRISYIRDLEHAQDEFVSDDADIKIRRQDAAVLSNIVLRTRTQAAALPPSVMFLEMYGVGRIEHLNILKRWQESNPVKTLAAPVGIATDGSLFNLDLHQKFEGPHGLVAGMTGSGKSEFLLTYILSMAINYRPEEVAFILIDYKGGGLVGAFEDESRGIHLPHLMGTITNLDGAAIQRSLRSINSELRRRQRIFNEAKSANNAGTMDIYDYQKLYSLNKVKEPLPHLFIISDEFAELKQQQPEFMDQLISTARIGRSLGVHLILATQKPAGVVNDQIVSNTKFRVCLKVQDKADSMDMLKRPEAAEIKETGRFYLQVGYNEFFALGQSAWSGAPYEPQDEVAVRKDDTIRFIDRTGQTLQEVKPAPARTGTGKSQLVEIVDMLSELAAAMNIPRRRLWLDPLPLQLDAASIEESLKAGRSHGAADGMYCSGSMDSTQKPVSPDNVQMRSSATGAHGKTISGGNSVQAVIGTLDDPENQAQMPLVLNMQALRNLMAVGSSGSGKTMFLETMILQMAERYSPEQVNFYILTGSGNDMDAFEKLSHCGALVHMEETQYVKRFFRKLDEIMAQRRKVFKELEVTDFESACMLRPMPLILVIFDNMDSMKDSSDLLNYYYALPQYMKDGLACGIRFILSCGSFSAFSSKVRQEIGDYISFHLKDKYEYSEVLGVRCEYVPADAPGRGLAVSEGRPLEFQAAMYFPALKGQDRTAAIRDKIAGISARYGGSGAAGKIGKVPETEKYADFAARFAPGRLPLGYYTEEGTAVALPYQQFSMLTVYFGNKEGIRPVTDNFLHAFKKEGMDVTIFTRQSGSVLKDCAGVRFLPDDDKSLQEFAKELLGEIKKRQQILIQYCDQNGIDHHHPRLRQLVFDHMRKAVTPRMIILESYPEVTKNASEDTQTVLARIMDFSKFFQIYWAGFMCPDEAAGSGAIRKAFNPEELIFLSGGLTGKQSLTAVPRNYAQEKMTAYNRFLIKYRDNIYPLLMPCGDLSEESPAEEERNIFDSSMA